MKLTAEERRERNRLRSERYRRAKGIMPRRPAQKPWLALAISRSTFYRRRKRAQEARAAILREIAIARATSLADQRARTSNDVRHSITRSWRCLRNWPRGMSVLIKFIMS